ncbi:helix-turn-helix domain-containing protein [Micromonospora sp. RB23]
MAVSSEITTARRELGRHLARLRKEANLTQQGLARLVQYGRSSVANTETGRQHPEREFWVRSDTALRTGGILTQQYDRLTRRVQRSQPQPRAKSSHRPQPLGCTDPSASPDHARAWDSETVSRAGFFDRQVAAAHVEPERITEPRPVWMKPEAVIPGVVAEGHVVVVHTDHVAVAISSLVGYPAGFEFSVTAMLRTSDRQADLSHHHRAGQSVPACFLRVGVQFADGSIVTNMDRAAPTPLAAEPPGPLLLPGNAEADARRHEARYWVWPLPPSGLVTFVCEWPAYDVPESRVHVDGQMILDAAARSVRLW